jgi:hypothetical protein
LLVTAVDDREKYGGQRPDEKAVLALQEQRMAGPASRIAPLLREQEQLAAAGRVVDEAAQRSLRAFERDMTAVTERVKLELPDLTDRVRAPFGRPTFAGNPLQHVFGPGLLGWEWAWLGDGQAGASKDDATFWASNYTTGPARFTVAKVGVQFRPQLASCKLSIRPYVRWSGTEVLTHRVHQPGTSEQRNAWALGSVGISVDSFNVSGGGDFHDGERWVDLWNHAEPNPSVSLDHDGATSVSDGLELEVFAVSSRLYAIGIECRVGVSADPGFEVSTYATSSISCQCVYFVVEEIVL